MFAGKDAIPGQRAARRDAAGGGRLGRDRAREVRHEVARGGPAAGHRAGRRLPDVRVPPPLPRDRARRVRAVRVDDADLLSRRQITPVGEMFRQPNLAATLRALAAAEKAALARGATREQAIEAGRDAFYKGPIARDMTAAVREAGGVMTEEDLAATTARSRSRRRRRIAATPSTRPASGTRGRRCCRRSGSSKASTSRRWARARPTRCTRSSKRSSWPTRIAIATTAIRISSACPATCCCRRRTRRCAARLIDPKRASLEQRPGDPARGTALLDLPAEAGSRLARRSGRPSQGARRHDVDPGRGRRRAICSPRRRARAGCSAARSSPGATGVPMSNRMQAFHLDPASPNVLAGGKRPRTTLTPTVVLKDGKPFLAIGTPGGDSQDQQILLVLLNIIDFGMDVQAAIEAPRVNSLHPVSSFDNHRAQPGVLEVESTLAAVGHRGAEGARARPADPRGRTASPPASSPPASTRSPAGCAAAPTCAASARSSPGDGSGSWLMAHEHFVHQAHARQRARRPDPRGSRAADRRGQRLVSRRIEERSAGTHRLRAPVRAPDVRGLAALRPRLLPSAAGSGRRAQRLDQRRPHELLGSRARPTRSTWRCGWNPIAWATCCRR